MKKILALIFAVLLVVSMLVSCSAKCEKCGKPAMKVTAEDKRQVEAMGFEVDKDLCEDCWEDYFYEQAYDMFY